jgi:hypothetical protein
MLFYSGGTNRAHISFQTRCPPQEFPYNSFGSPFCRIQALQTVYSRGSGALEVAG